MPNIVVTVDAFGRLLVPKNVRRAFPTKRFSLNVEDDEIRLTPIKGWESLFGSIPSLSVKKLEQMRREEAEVG